MVVNPDVFESLSDDQQAALRTAAVDALPSMIDQTVADEDAAREALCEAGLTFTLTSDDQLAGIREALQPVYDEIASHGDNAAVLAQIETLKEELAVPPDGPTCETAAQPTDAGSFPEGT